MKNIVLVWARELRTGVTEPPHGRRTLFVYLKYKRVEGLEDVERTIAEQGGLYAELRERTDRYQSKEYIDLKFIAEDIRDSFGYLPHPPSDLEIKICTPKELQEGFILGRDFLDRRLSDEERRKLAEECIKGVLLPVDCSNY